MSVGYYVLAALGLAVLMVVHEGGHFLAARHFKMRVVRFSIGFGPTLWKRRPKGSPTVYQVAIIPFLAYVQIAGMNPYEDNDPKDPGSYANASLWHASSPSARGHWRITSSPPCSCSWVFSSAGTRSWTRQACAFRSRPKG